MKRPSSGKWQKTLSGTGLSPGIGLGTAYILEPCAPGFYRLRIEASEVPAELERFQQALDKSRRQLKEIKRKFEAAFGEDQAYIIDAHLLILEDPRFLEEIDLRIQNQLESPERAVREAAEEWLASYRTVGDPFFTDKGSDLSEVADRVTANLVELGPERENALPKEMILVGSSISLSAMADFELERIKGLVTTRGGEASHLTIVARSCQIPLVAGIERLSDCIRDGQELVVDGSEGWVRVGPSREEIHRYQLRSREERDRASSLTGEPFPVTTRDGRRVVFYVNTEVGSEVHDGLRLGAEGIGLFRSEYVFMQCKSEPVSEEIQFQAYSALARTIGDRPAFIRTLDIGDEGHPFFAALAGEAEPVLGMRGIRLSLKHPSILKSQVRAILRAGLYGNLKIALPMVSSADELIEARNLIDEAYEELQSQGLNLPGKPQVGAMVEVPAAVYTLDSIADQADFLSVGSNDLIQYTLAVGRSNERIAELYNPFHPAILRSLDRIGKVARERSLLAMVCGEIASSPRYGVLLVGMGFQHLSMNPYSIPALQRLIRQITFAQARETVREMLQLETLTDVSQFVGERLAPLVSKSLPNQLVEG
ncbi:MAG: phosphoenolpyruvate--protein phosphotransferase [Acidobacteriota bacterium]